MDPGPMTVEELINLGQETARLLNSPSVGVGLQVAVRDLQNQWLESKPEEKNKREGLYWQLQGMTQFYRTMTGFVQHAEAQLNERSQKKQMEDAAIQAGVPLSEI